MASCAVPRKASVANLCFTINFICGPARESSGCDKNASSPEASGQQPLPTVGTVHRRVMGLRRK